MDFDVLEFSKMLSEKKITVIYSGPIWADGVEGMAEFLQRKLDVDNLSRTVSKSIFSVFVEQMHNMLMYSAEKEIFTAEDDDDAVLSKGMFVMGKEGDTYFIKTGNVVTDYSAGVLKERIDYLNTLDKQGLRQYFKEKQRSDDDNPESKGAGMGLIEIARRSSSKINYKFTPQGEGFKYFSMSVEI